jgi:2-polyprenyl-6-methoxyphenol hydroxylase-like FAD-dependent oxidoreductase
VDWNFNLEGAMKVVIIGGGIGGLTTAIALNKVGIDVQIYERAPELGEVGAGIALASNAIRALDVLGLANDLQASSVGARDGAIRNAKGNILASIPAQQLGSVAIVHRAELLSLLARRIDPERIHLGRTFVHLEQNSDGIKAHFDTGEIVPGDALIGADGLRSAIRAQLFPKSVVRYAGYTGWRAVVNFPEPLPPASETWGRGRRFGLVPMGGGRVYWFATNNAPEGQRDPAGRIQESLAQRFRGWPEPVEELIAAAREDSILRNDIYDLVLLPRLVQGRVALLGDAAHATTPNLGQGACQAIEDAVVIAASLKTAPRLEPGLLEYERRRIPRVSQISRRSRNMGVVAQLENPAACWLRDSMMRLAPNGAGLRQMKSLLEVEILTPAERAIFEA